MAVASVNDMTRMVPELSAIDSGTIQLYLDDAQNTIELQGIVSTNDSFAQLQRYLCAHMFQVNGLVSGDIKSKSVADVSVSYGGASSQSGAFSTNWYKLYNDLKTSILGMKERILS